MYCVKCGNKLDKNDKFCTKCGSENGGVGVVSNNSGSDSLSIVLGVISLFLFWCPLVGIICGVFAIISAKKYYRVNNKNSGGLVLGIIGLILSLLFTIFIFLLLVIAFNVVDKNSSSIENKIDDYLNRFYDSYEDNKKDIDKYKDKFEEEFSDDKDVDEKKFSLGSNIWRGSDNSFLYLNFDGSYSWYMNDNVHDDNYYVGHYSVYNGLDAVNYIVKNFSNYGLTYDKQMKLFDGGNYEIDDYYLLILDCDKAVMNGNVENSFKGIIPYYGFYNDDKRNLSLVNMKTGNNADFSLSKSNENKGIM